MIRDGNHELAIALHELSSKIATTTEAAMRKAVREACVMALDDIEQAVMARLNAPRIVIKVDPEEPLSHSITVSFPERP